MSTPCPPGLLHVEGALAAPPARSRLPKAITVAVPACLALLVVAAYIARAGDVPLADLLRDTTTTLEAPFYIGLVSNAGILLWGACLTICLLTASVASRTGRSTRGSFSRVPA